MNTCSELCQEVLDAQRRLDEGKSILDTIPQLARNIENLTTAITDLTEEQKKIKENEDVKELVHLLKTTKGFLETLKWLRALLFVLAPLIAFFVWLAYVFKKAGF